MREIFCSEMVAAFKKNPFVFLTGDLGFKALEPIREAMGDHFINAGVAEQNMISTAAGIAQTGLPVFCYSIAPFIYARPFEQIRNDICLHKLPVFLVGNGGGYGYGVMGATHHAIEDYGALLTLQNMNIFVPVFDTDIGAMITKITTEKKPSYLRLGLEQKVEGVDKTYSSWRKILEGDLGILVACGSIGGNLLVDFQQEEMALRPAIWLISELSSDFNLPEKFSTEIAEKKLCIAEEHVAQGGIGQMIATKILEKNIALKSFSHLHARGYVSGLFGSQNFFREESGLTREKILESLSALSRS
jgi:transketolase